MSTHRSGWALVAFVGRKSHYWDHDMRFTADDGTIVDGYQSRCGLSAVAYQKVPMFWGHDAGHCKNCERKVP